MQKHTSLYIDALRVLAAMLVFFSHLTRPSLSASNPLIAFFGQFGQEGVAIFFVISGVVIAHVSREKERDLRSYLVARLGRLWSVMLPALVLTVVLDVWGRLIAPGMYAETEIQPWGVDLASAWNFIGTLLFLNKVSFATADPGTNGPFWSLCFEFWYYLIFGVAFFLSGLRRWLLLVAAALIAGRAVLALFPIWISGVLLYACLRRVDGRRPISTGAWAASCVVLLILMAMKYRLGVVLAAALPGLHINSLGAADFLAHFAVGLMCAINIFLYDASGGVNIFRDPTLQRAVRFLAARSFSLYLYQAPCLFFFGAVTYKLESPLLRLAIIIVLAIATILLLAECTERRKAPFVRLVERLVPHFFATARRSSVTRSL